MSAMYRIDTTDVRKLVGDLGAMEPAARTELRRGFRAVGMKVGQRVKARASWSSRIPAAVRVQPLTGARTAGVFLRVDADRAPHARPYEGISKSSGTRFFRHRVFGTDTWVAEPTRPFLGPAARESAGEAQEAAEAAVRAAARVGRFT